MSFFLNEEGLANLLPQIVLGSRNEVQQGVSTVSNWANNTFVPLANVNNTTLNSQSFTDLPVSGVISMFINNTLNNLGEVVGTHGQLYSWDATNNPTAINVATTIFNNGTTDFTPVSVGSIVNIITNMTNGVVNTVPLYNGFGTLGGGLVIDSYPNVDNTNNLIFSSGVANAIPTINNIANQLVNLNTFTEEMTNIVIPAGTPGRAMLFNGTNGFIDARGIDLGILSNTSNLASSQAVLGALNNIDISVLNNAQINSIFTNIWNSTGNYNI